MKAISLNLSLDPASAVPLYAQVVEQIRSLVATGGLAVGDRLPSVRDLAVALRINRNTAAKAYQVLEGDGILETRSGQGSFVAQLDCRWSHAERRRRLSALLDRVLVEACHLGVSFSQVESLLARRMESFTRRPGRFSLPGNKG
ncbi:MAG: GntR family transcriptional regulator [Acidobacteriota bacterium]